MEVIIIAAMAENRVIGKDNTLPWSIKEDLARFHFLTDRWPCIMGRKTWESLPKRPLPNRLNVIISRSLSDYKADNVVVLPSLQEAIHLCKGHQKVFICGGAGIYKEAMSLATKIELTLIHKQYDGDTFFPEIDPQKWIVTNTINHDGFSFISYLSIVNNSII